MKTLNLLSNINISTVILCGGKSSRFNFNDKALLKYDNNKNFLEKIISECKGDVFLSVDNADKYKSFLSESNIKVIEDIYKDIGALGGIYSSFKNIESDYIQFLSCDTPTISYDFIDYMISMADEYHDAFIPVYQGNVYFLCGIYSKNILSVINENIDNKEYSIKKLIDKIKVKYIDLKYTKFKLFNINTLEDYLSFQKSMPQYFAVCGKRNCGKTDLICKLIKEFVNIGKTVAVIKHTSHDHSFDAQGKDTYNFKESGAKAALIYSPLKYMMVQDYEKSVNENDDLSNFIDKMKGYDLIILEGFKHINNIPKIEVFRTSVSDKPFCDDKSIMALVTDNLSYKTDLPILNINDISSIMNFIISNIITI